MLDFSILGFLYYVELVSRVLFPYLVMYTRFLQSTVSFSEYTLKNLVNAVAQVQDWKKLLSARNTFVVHPSQFLD